MIFRRAAENGPVQEKCEGVSSYGLWGLRARLCAMNVRSERMLVSARFSDTAQLGRVCKKSVRPSGRGVQGGSLSKKMRLNYPYTCVIFYRISAALKIPGFRPRNGCFQGRFRPGLSGGLGPSLCSAPGCRFSARMGDSGGSWGAGSEGGFRPVLGGYVRRFRGPCPVISRSCPAFAAALFVPGFRFRESLCRGPCWTMSWRERHGAFPPFLLFPPCPGRRCSALLRPVVCAGYLRRAGRFSPLLLYPFTRSLPRRGPRGTSSWRH